ncbi:hypothetical protein TTRE_0000640901 [Trichuris trichiura]|uniref:EGF-like domain-containing protein n=1 Tax=Trichuris trichiura TaxID=36087 RepID=A0A077ZCI6_TRITR|nr:hypothetical protein TTRE_0000640901 [Trichuris trichiura]
MFGIYCITALILSTAVLWCHAYPQLLDYDKTDCIYHFWRNEHRLDYPMAIMSGVSFIAPWWKHYAPLNLCPAMTPEGRTIGFLWPVGMKTLCSSDKALEHIWSQTKSSTNRTATGRLLNVVRPNLKRSQRFYDEVVVNGYVVVGVNSTQKGKIYNVAYKLIESVNASVITHTVDNGVVVKPDLALYYNFTDLEKSTKEHLKKGERIIVLLQNDKLYYVHENKFHDQLEAMKGEHRERDDIPYISFCSYTNYMKYCAEKLEEPYKPGEYNQEKYGCKQCRPGFAGFHCYIGNAHQNDCENNPCVNGWCVDLVGGYKCICERGMEGDNCAKSENKCARLDCVGGTCKLHNGMPYCKCDEDHYGVHCEIEMDPCMSSPCRRDAHCINDLKNKGFLCVCPEGYEGFDCKQSMFQSEYYDDAFMNT